MVRIYLVLVLVLCAGGVRAELNSLFPKPDEAPELATRASLFAPTPRMGFFAPLPDRSPPALIAPITGTGT